MVRSQLVDLRNWAEQKPIIIAKVAAAGMIGLDIESHDDNAHENLKRFRGKRNTKAFDTQRTTVTGFSIFCDGDDVAYYINLAHADVENRIPWEEAIQILDAKGDDSCWLCHKAPYELTMLPYPLTNVICTMQMCISAYGPDEYDQNDFLNAGLGDIKNLIPSADRAFRTYTPGKPMNPDQSEVFHQVIGKQSKATHSYNGFVTGIAYGYALKKAVKNWFGVQMTTFAECIGDKEHMGQLTGEEVVAYGADDAYWAVRLFHRVLQFMMETNPGVVQTFFDQENPMIYIYANIWREGFRVNTKAITKRRAAERENCAEALRELKLEVRALLPFPDEPHEGLMKTEKWYQKNSASYRQRVENWALSPNVDDDLEQVRQAAGAVPNAWSSELGMAKPKGPNLTHYMVMRTIMYDLMRQKTIMYKGKVQSDGESRGKLLDRVGGSKVLEGINKLAGIEQRMKLYLTPYSLLMDPDTGRMYPEVSSMLATRRMASSNPNGMQLAKRGESTYVRGFFLPDTDEEVLVSIDWAQIELVEIGDFSRDPEFAKCYSQLPYKDLHLGAAADALNVVIPEMTEEILLRLHLMSIEEANDINPAILINIRGEAMTPDKAKKYWRTEVGKGANFNYWYSGALSTVGEKLGWTSEQMWEATDRYRNRFAVAEEWRKAVIMFGKLNGYIELPDGHRRVRFEGTPQWAAMMRARFEAYGTPGVALFGGEVIRATQTRAGNQMVNALIQGTCATLAKRSILRIDKEIKETGFPARFKLPNHDELIYSVHKKHVVEFNRMAKGIMCNHPDIITTLVIDASTSVGLTFEPWHAKKAPMGQIELDEAPLLDCLPPETEGGKLNDDHIRAVVDWLEHERKRAA